MGMISFTIYLLNMLNANPQVVGEFWDGGGSYEEDFSEMVIYDF